MVAALVRPIIPLHMVGGWVAHVGQQKGVAPLGSPHSDTTLVSTPVRPASLKASMSFHGLLLTECQASCTKCGVLTKRTKQESLAGKQGRMAQYGLSWLRMEAELQFLATSSVVFVNNPHQVALQRQGSTRHKTSH